VALWPGVERREEGVHLEAERCVARHLDAARVAPYSVPSSEAIRSRSTSFNGNAMQQGLAIAICRPEWMTALGHSAMDLETSSHTFLEATRR
jgi:hypothetical protein